MNRAMRTRETDSSLYFSEKFWPPKGGVHFVNCIDAKQPKCIDLEIWNYFRNFAIKFKQSYPNESYNRGTIKRLYYAVPGYKDRITGMAENR